jgi:hypothetical protein
MAIAFETAAQSAQRELFRDKCCTIGKAERRRVFDMTETMTVNSRWRMGIITRDAIYSASTFLEPLKENLANSAKIRDVPDVQGGKNITTLKRVAAIETVQTLASELNRSFNRGRSSQHWSALELRNRNSPQGSEFTLALPRPARVPASSEAAKGNVTEILESGQRRPRESSGTHVVRGASCIFNLRSWDSLHARTHLQPETAIEIVRGDNIAPLIARTKETHEIDRLTLAGDIRCNKTRSRAKDAELSRPSFSYTHLTADECACRRANFAREVKLSTHAFTTPKRADDRENVRQNAPDASLAHEARYAFSESVHRANYSQSAVPGFSKLRSIGPCGMKHWPPECFSSPKNGLREAPRHAFRVQIIQLWLDRKPASASETQHSASGLCRIDSSNFRDARLLGTRALGILSEPLHSQWCSYRPAEIQNGYVALEIFATERSRFVSRRTTLRTGERTLSPTGRVARILRLARARFLETKFQVAGGRGSSARREVKLPPGPIPRLPGIVPFANLMRGSSGTAQKIRATRLNTPLDIQAAAGCRSW